MYYAVFSAPRFSSPFVQSLSLLSPERFKIRRFDFYFRFPIWFLGVLLMVRLNVFTRRPQKIVFTSPPPPPHELSPVLLNLSFDLMTREILQFNFSLRVPSELLRLFFFLLLLLIYHLLLILLDHSPICCLVVVLHQSVAPPLTLPNYDSYVARLFCTLWRVSSEIEYLRKLCWINIGAQPSLLSRKFNSSSFEIFSIGGNFTGTRRVDLFSFKTGHSVTYFKCCPRENHWVFFFTVFHVGLTHFTRNWETCGTPRDLAI